MIFYANIITISIHLDKIRFYLIYGQSGDLSGINDWLEWLIKDNDSDNEFYMKYLS